MSKLYSTTTLLGKSTEPAVLKADPNDGSDSSGSTGGLGAALVNAVMKSPLYYPIVKSARKTMVQTAESAGIDWNAKYQFLRAKMDDEQWTSTVTSIMNENERLDEWPEYYQQKFHGYGEGNLCLDAAIEQEIAGKAVGARNFPEEGKNGERVLRDAYDTQIVELLGSRHVEQARVVYDLGCGTGTSTRRMALLYHRAERVLGIDLSPFMLAVGRYLLREGGTSIGRGEWVDDLATDKRISLRYADITDTGLPSASADVVSVCLVMHELPQAVTKQVIAEAYRLLKPGGSLVIMEMDPQAPGYMKLRSNAMLFSLLRSTEPYLDEYFDIAPYLPKVLQDEGFGTVRISAATGRHLCIAATKGGVVDVRPDAEERERSDRHLAPTQRAVT
jgi:ubiquinone/menaquinone biosynthesis C-methylase UbiE